MSEFALCDIHVINNLKKKNYPFVQFLEMSQIQNLSKIDDQFICFF